MKANELMFGDWVFCDGQPTPSKVVIQTVSIDGVWFEGDKFEGSASFDHIFPIPITTEILEKNGFDIQYQGGMRFDVWCSFGPDSEGDIEIEFRGQEPIHLKIDGTYKGVYYTSANMKYVHELQHALRLCGIEKEIVL